MATVNKTITVTNSTARAENWGEREFGSLATTVIVTDHTFSSMAMFRRRERGSMIRMMVAVFMTDVLMTQASGSVPATTTGGREGGEVQKKEEEEEEEREKRDRKRRERREGEEKWGGGERRERERGVVTAET